MLLIADLDITQTFPIIRLVRGFRLRKIIIATTFNVVVHITRTFKFILKCTTNTGHMTN